MPKAKDGPKAIEACVSLPIDQRMLTRLDSGPVIITIQLVLQMVTHNGQKRIGVDTLRTKMKRAPKTFSDDAA